MAEYQKNNIIFRIASSDAISKFKAKQAAALLQLTRKDLNFVGAPKESVLLEYDMMSHWLYKVERICLVSGHGATTDKLKNALVQSFMDECRSMQVVMESHVEVFDPTIIKFTNVIHAYTVKMFQSFCETSLKNTNSTNTFVLISNFVSDYLEHFLVSMHELTGNLLSKRFNTDKRPVLSSTDFCLEAEITQLIEPSVLRATFFKDLGCGSFYEFKNYSSKDIFSIIQSHLMNADINLFPEVNITEHRGPNK
jgi:hypothetical protein